MWTNELTSYKLTLINNNTAEIYFADTIYIPCSYIYVYPNINIVIR